MGSVNAKLVKKAHTRKIKGKGGVVKMVKVKAATVGSIANNKSKRKKH